MNRKPIFGWLLVLMLGTGLAQADEFSDALHGFFKKKLKGKESTTAPAPQQPAQPVAPNAPNAPSQPAAPALAKEQPGDQLLKALLQGKTSLEEEERIGQQIAGNLLGAAHLVRDDALQRYVNRVGRWVALQSERPDLDWHFGVIESEDINAFAAPGGYVFLTRGLYRQLHNEAELAGVLGHEIGHVVKKHHLKLLQKSQAIAAVGSFFGSKVDSNEKMVQNIIGNGAEIVARGLDKDAEFEADRLGLVYAARAGYDAYGLPTVLADIGHVAKGDKRVSLLFKTHPLPEVRLDRLADAVSDRLDNLPEGQSGAGRFYQLKN